MSLNHFRGDAPEVAQVNTITPASPTVGNTFTVTMNGKSVTFTATAATVANVTAGLVAEIGESSIPEFQEVLAEDGTTNLTLTARKPGKPFTQTSTSATGSGSAGHSLTTSTTTSSAGPNHWGDTKNWTLGAIPVDGDDVTIPPTAEIFYDLDQNTVDLLSLTIGVGAKIGLPDYDESGGYYQYRTKLLTLTADTVNLVVQDESAGQGRYYLSLGNNATTINVSATGSPVDTGRPALLINGHASATYNLNITKGNVGIAIDDGTACVLGTVRVGNEGNPSGDVTLTLGSGCTTITTVETSGGVIVANNTVTTLYMDGGEWTQKAGAITTCYLDSGRLTYQSTGTITTLNIGTGATINFSEDIRDRTVTNCTIQAGATIIDTYKSATWTNGIVLDRCAISEVSIDLGTNLTLLVSSPAEPNCGAYTALIGDGVATSYTINAATHGLAASNKMVVGVYLAATGVQEFPQVAINNSTGAVTVVFSSAPSSNAYRVVIVGATT